MREELQARAWVDSEQHHHSLSGRHAAWVVTPLGLIDEALSLGSSLPMYSPLRPHVVEAELYGGIVGYT